ncbi:hypothetical protein MSG28_015628 [Choristoneura fumiferana]|uniref:Uncharacterized protein n=1 Tax=Choristoneura fumiferana TaxID=7141 RepID=A0ACC0KAV0_CHOFU|nr:hypothetical protein MSG28_015628 [Choristoneura fumiferana]
MRSTKPLVLIYTYCIESDLIALTIKQTSNEIEEAMASSVDHKVVIQHIVNGTLADNLCLICLLPLDELSEHILTKICKGDKEYCIADVFEELFQVQFSEVNQHRVCSDCFITASAAFKFYLSAKRSQEILNFYTNELQQNMDFIDTDLQNSEDSICISLPMFIPSTEPYDYDLEGLALQSSRENADDLSDDSTEYKPPLSVSKTPANEVAKVEVKTEIDADQIVIIMNEDGRPSFLKQDDDGTYIAVTPKDEIKYMKMFGYVDKNHVISGTVADDIEKVKQRRKRGPMSYLFCSKCPVKYRFVAKLKEHMKTEHNIDLFVCQVCKATMEDEQEYTNHLKTHTNTHTCAICTCFANHAQDGSLKSRREAEGPIYICRAGTTRRWMCHGFLASRDSGERLSHAVGCAFAACLERKQRRDKECAVSMSIDAASHAFTRQGSFRKSTITSRRVSEADTPPLPALPAPAAAPRPTPHNPFAVERPHAAPHLLERQGSFRGFAHLNNSSPFKRQMSLRISELPSNLERTRAGLGSPPRAPPTLPTQPAHSANAAQPAQPSPFANVTPQPDTFAQSFQPECEDRSHSPSTPAPGPAAPSQDDDDMPEVISTPELSNWMSSIEQCLNEVCSIASEGKLNAEQKLRINNLCRKVAHGTSQMAVHYQSVKLRTVQAHSSIQTLKSQLDLSQRLQDLKMSIDQSSKPTTDLSQRLKHTIEESSKPALGTSFADMPSTAEDPVAAMCQQLSLGLRQLAEEPVPVAPVPLPAGAPHPDAWLGRVARAPPLAATARAQSFAGHVSTNPFLTPTPAPM